MEVPLTGAGNDAPLLSYCSVDCHYIKHTLRPRSGADVISLILEDRGLELCAGEESFVSEGSFLTHRSHKWRRQKGSRTQ